MTAEAAASVERFADAIRSVVDAAVAELAPPGRRVARVAWGAGDGPDHRTTLEVELDDGTIIAGSGPARLEAVMDAASRAS